MNKGNEIGFYSELGSDYETMYDWNFNEVVVLGKTIPKEVDMLDALYIDFRNVSKDKARSALREFETRWKREKGSPIVYPKEIVNSAFNDELKNYWGWEGISKLQLSVDAFKTKIMRSGFRKENYYQEFHVENEKICI